MAFRDSEHARRAAIASNKNRAWKKGGTWKSEEAKRRSLANLNLARRGQHHRGKLKVPERGDPLIREFFKLMNRELVTFAEVSARSGVRANTFVGWRYQGPRLANFRAAVEALGYRLKIVKQYGAE